ncbi:hypothetical protein TRAPUB_7904 [Trametes pubescens]|uniref:Uncharacterized protein n=1 Tax=Trametes pubescens TaxID=154538 RepID=A0A1M2V238_TRAPU|nr:hypothetical protein TRAPUB_7904 [Trametes pubescens]
MLTAHILALSVLGSALALPKFGSRQDFSDEDLFNSCPGGPGSSKFEKADRCTLDGPVDIPDVRHFVALGQPQLNCGGGTDPITVTLGGEKTVSTTTTVDASVGFDIDGLTIGGGASTENSESSTMSKQVSFQIPPKRQAVFVAGQNNKAQNGRVQVNFGDRQFGHFIWFTSTNVTRLTPIDGDVEFDVHVSDCGTDATDLSSYNKQ